MVYIPVHIVSVVSSKIETNSSAVVAFAKYCGKKSVYEKEVLLGYVIYSVYQYINR